MTCLKIKRKRSIVPSQVPKPLRQLHCDPCDVVTVHALAPTSEGCSWVCDECKLATHAFSHEEMAQTVMRKFFHIPKHVAACTVPENYTVFIEKGNELPREILKEHVAITGKLPVAGDHIFVRPPGVCHQELAFPSHVVSQVKTEV